MASNAQTFLRTVRGANPGPRPSTPLSPTPGPNARPALRPVAPSDGIRTVRGPGVSREVIAWDQLADGASEPNPFLESWYLEPSLRHLGPADEPELLCFDHRGQLAGLLPVTRPVSYYGWPVPHLETWLHPNMFLGTPLVARGAEHEFWRALLGWADDHPGMAAFLHLRLLALEGPVHAALRDVLVEQSREAALVHHAERAALASAAPADEILETAMSGRKRKELRRQLRRLGELGEVRFERRGDAGAITDWTEDFLRLEASGWKAQGQSAMLSDPATAALMRESLARAAGRGQLERMALRLDGRPIAMLATFVSGRGGFSFKTAFDERYARFSPGMLLQCDNLDLLVRRSLDWCDSCAEPDHAMIDHVWRERRAIGSYSIAIGGAPRRALFHQLVALEMRRQAGEKP